MEAISEAGASQFKRFAPMGTQPCFFRRRTDPNAHGKAQIIPPGRRSLPSFSAQPPATLFPRICALHTDIPSPTNPCADDRSIRGHWFRLASIIHPIRCDAHEWTHIDFPFHLSPVIHHEPFDSPVICYRRSR